MRKNEKVKNERNENSKVCKFLQSSGKWCYNFKFHTQI